MESGSWDQALVVLRLIPSPRGDRPDSALVLYFWIKPITPPASQH